MDEGVYVEIPIEPVEPITVEINAEGTSFGTFYHIEGGAPVTLESVTLSPLSIQMEYSFAAADGDAFPLLFFRMTDGSLRSWGQIVGDSSLAAPPGAIRTSNMPATITSSAPCWISPRWTR